MLSRAASSLYWLGRYIERAEFTSRLVEATLRLDAVSAPAIGAKAWEDALEVLGQKDAFEATGAPLEQSAVTRFLTVDASLMSRPIVEKLGFVPISTSMPCTWQCKPTIQS